MGGAQFRFDEGAGFGAQAGKVADRAQRRGKVDVQEIPRRLGMGEEFPGECLLIDTYKFSCQAAKTSGLVSELHKRIVKSTISLPFETTLVRRVNRPKGCRVLLLFYSIVNVPDLPIT
jgi:hypothetical protein